MCTPTPAQTTSGYLRCTYRWHSVTPELHWDAKSAGKRRRNVQGKQGTARNTALFERYARCDSCIGLTFHYGDSYPDSVASAFRPMIQLSLITWQLLPPIIWSLVRATQLVWMLCAQNWIRCTSKAQCFCICKLIFHQKQGHKMAGGFCRVKLNMHCPNIFEKEFKFRYNRSRRQIWTPATRTCLDWACTN